MQPLGMNPSRKKNLERDINWEHKQMLLDQHNIRNATGVLHSSRRDK